MRQSVFIIDKVIYDLFELKNYKDYYVDNNKIVPPSRP